MKTEPKKDPRVIRTRRLLQDAFITLMEERDLEQITVQDIVDRATIKRATFYLHFKDKHELLNCIVDQVLKELNSVVNVKWEMMIESKFTSDKPHPLFVGIFHHIAEHYHLYRAMLVTNRVPCFTAGLSAVLHEFVTYGINHTEPDDQNLTAKREVIIKFVESAILEVIIWWVEQQMPYDEIDMAEQILNLSLKGPYIINPVSRYS
ncbi:TetR/AcrR family transcriptional regulator [Paenibacillus aquistagni]|uniref:TetR/AcrR family transcriptional regulator n=1 Tax=Paenibacillus aquistagni TaxID=1852522 RepID=UPI00145BB24C|nr:TetR/AcrR family transcriptional regulator [Paenibacillus aquistagni]NMM51660.1 TetR family transcriptional regulator [Paenibacillus aquistagni]